jgi:FAD/FMN-containing dehydrogenase
LDSGHEKLDGISPVHLFSDNRFDLSQHSKPDRQPRIYASGKSSNQSCAEHQFMADNFGVGGCFLGGCFGTWSKRFGSAASNQLQATAVLADGSVVTPSVSGYKIYLDGKTLLAVN